MKEGIYSNVWKLGVLHQSQGFKERIKVMKDGN